MVDRFIGCTPNSQPERLPQETSSGTAEALQAELSVARRRISELESLTMHSAEASHVQRVEDLQTQLYSQQDSVGESRLKLESALQDSQRELSETKQSLEQVKPQHKACGTTRLLVLASQDLIHHGLRAQDQMHVSYFDVRCSIAHASSAGGAIFVGMPSAGRRCTFVLVRSEMACWTAELDGGLCSQEAKS